MTIPVHLFVCYALHLLPSFITSTSFVFIFFLSFVFGRPTLPMRILTCRHVQYYHNTHHHPVTRVRCLHFQENVRIVEESDMVAVRV